MTVDCIPGHIVEVWNFTTAPRRQGDILPYFKSGQELRIVGGSFLSVEKEPR